MARYGEIMKIQVWETTSHKRKIEVEIPPDWIKEWNHVYLNVQEKLIQLQGYCRDDGKRVPCRRGLRVFLGSILRKDCPMREAVRAQIVHEEIPVTSLETRLDFLNQLKKAIR